MAKKKALFVLGADPYRKIYGEAQKKQVNDLVDVYAPPQTARSTADSPEILNEAEVIMSGWRAPRMDAKFLADAPRLEAVFYGAGSVRGMVSDDLWDRGIIVTSSYAANAIPVAEFTLSQIIFCLKLGWRHAFAAKRKKEWRKLEVPGCYKSRVGLISMGMIARKTLALLRPFDLETSVYSTSMTEDEASELKVRLCTLEEIFETCDVVSLHTPNLPQTRGMIKGSHFASMKRDASFINTARGAVIDEPAMIEALKKRPDVTAVLDVTFPEPPESDSPLWTLPNVVLVPHIAGSMSAECRRMGQYAADELRRYLNGEPLQWRITREMAAKLA
ncbi:MAG: hydroxyacid dehydrogenase [Kiritimatiellia bacterium]